MSEENTNKKADTITIKKDDLWRYSTFALLGVLVLGAIFFVLPSGQTINGNVVNEGNKPGNTLPPPTANLEIQEGDYVKGNANAEITIFEFSDFECPFCGGFYKQTLSQIEKEYIDTGKVKFVYKHFPLDNIHPFATPAAEAYECAGEQGKAWDMHDLLFEQGVQGGVSSFKAFAGQLELDQTQFDNCIDSGKYAEKIKADIAQGTAAGIRGTPGFIINGRLVSGAQPFAAFQQVIEAELA